MTPQTPSTMRHGSENKKAEQEAHKAKTTIKDWAEDDRPREKLLAKGAKALSTAELLAILIGSGTADKSAVELMRDIMHSCNDSLKTLGQYSLEQLCAFKGIGSAKAVTIMAAVELGLRRLEEFDTEDITRICSSNDIYRLMRHEMLDLQHEEFWCIMLNNAGKVIGKELISRGGITQTTVDVRLILRAAIMSRASAIILCHNHPSGNKKPSNDDIRLTSDIKSASKLMNIKTLDHLVITPSGYYSFADEGLL